MDSAKQRQNAKKFISEWKGYEKGETQKFWISLLQDVLGVPQAIRLLDFEKQVIVDGQTKFIDGYIKPTKILIEQKGASIDLNKKYKQSGGAMLTPFEQAKRYATDLGKNFYPNYIVVCNFKEFHIHDMSDTNAEPVIIKIEDLPSQIHRLDFLVDVEKELSAFEQEISIEAGEIVGEIYEALLAQYKNKENPDSLKSLNKLCVRLVFCLYAEDSGLFSTHLEFHNYLRKYSVDARGALIQLFKVLNTPEDKRDPYLSDDLLAFPYVNGGLFADEDLEIPKLTQEIIDLILKKASEGFDWSLISPTIFGAVFESTLNPETRRSGGMHYTSVQNIHKVIDPLFLDELKAELSSALELKVPATRNKRLEQFRAKLGKLTFLDPACGSGNFLTETYTSLRKLENEALRVLYEGQMAFGESFSPIQVHISQFFGIEINDFAVTVSRTALWIAESQMMKETEDIVGQSLDFLPLKSAAHIHEGNALRMDWNEVIPASQLYYIMGNPPFVGYSNQSPVQKEEIRSVYVDESGQTYKTAGKNDYVSGWFFKAADFIKNTKICCAFVSTNSITQGEQVANVWKPLFSRFGIQIDFAYSTFKWTSDSLENAAVHVVIVGFSCQGRGQRTIYSETGSSTGKNISPYLTLGDTVFIESRSSPIVKDVPKMVYGNKPTDGGFLFISEEEYSKLVEEKSSALPYIKQVLGSTEFINNKKRYCIWLVGRISEAIKASKFIKDRVQSVRNFRLSSKKEATRKSADSAALFQEVRQPDTSYVLVPCHSSEKRSYIPMGFIGKEIIASNANLIIPDSTLYHFGVLTSSVHMAWMRTVAGRIKSDYRYSKDIVYNNFPWPNLTDKQKQKIEETAQAILSARVAHPENSLADLYDPLTMPKDLRKAHEDNDKAVKKAYGFRPSMPETEIVAELFRLYGEIVNGQEKEINEAKEKAKEEIVETGNRRKQKSVD